jgi:predicted flap endonuclease-1-like 5' DNA nuclease
MMTIVDANLILLAIALVIGFVIGWWMFRRPRAGGDIKLEVDREARPYLDPPEAQPDHSPPAMLRERSAPTLPRTRPIRDGIDTNERRGVLDEGAAAATDVAGQLLGIRAHAELPGAELPSAGEEPDNLQMLKGVGPKLAQKLADQGITRFQHLAALSPNEVTILEDKLGPFKGRLTRDRVVEQASYLARGDTDGFEARFGKLGGA